MRSRLTLLDTPSLSPRHSFVCTTRWLDLAGPSHFLACGSPTGGTLLKHRHLRQLGYALVVVPYWEWDQVRGDEAAEVEYLRGKLDSGVVGELAV